MKLTKLARILDSKMLLLSSIQELYFISHDMCIITIGSFLGIFFFCLKSCRIWCRSDLDPKQLGFIYLFFIQLQFWSLVWFVLIKLLYEYVSGN